MSEQSSQNQKSLSWLAYIFYGFPAMPLAALILPVYIFLPNYYAQTLGIGLAAVGVARLITGIWDVITDPVIGILSDKTKSRFGRRKIWIFFGLPVVMIGCYKLLIPPETADFLYLVIWSMVMYLGWTIMILPLNAMGAELSANYHERSTITAWREGFVVFGTLVTLGLVAALGFSENGEQAEALKTIAIFALMLLPVSTLLFMKFVPNTDETDKQDLSFKDGLVVLKENMPFRRLISSYFINAFANGLPAILIVIFVDHVLKDEGNVGPYLFAYFASGIFMIPLWLKLSKKFGKHKTWCGAMVWACLFFALVPFIGEGDTAFYLAICVLTGFAYGADLVLPSSMQADVVDIDRAKTGEQRTGLYFALWGMVTKLSLAFATALAFISLEQAGFVDGQTGSLLVIVLLYAVLPIILKVIAIFMMWTYPLDESQTYAAQEKSS